MSDHFMYAHRPAIPSGIEQRVKVRVMQARTMRKGPIRDGLEWATQHRLAAVVLLLLLLGACSVGVVRVGGFTFVGLKGTPPETAEPTPHPAFQELVPRTDALSQAPFEVSTPSWVPTGFAPRDRAMVTVPARGASASLAWQVWLYWDRGSYEEILLLAFPTKYYRGASIYLEPGVVRNVDLGGITGAAVQGNWRPNSDEWVESAGGNVLWVQGDTAYWLQSWWVSLEDLERMAESMH